MFKIRKKQKSISKDKQIIRADSILQVNRYRCLRQISDSEQHWKNLLRNQLQMGSTIVAFQNVQISMRVDAQKKLMLRETFMLKKQIIKMIVNEQYDLILPKLEQLRKTSPADYGLSTLFIDFYHIQKQIIASKHEYRPETIKHIKLKMEKYYQKLERQKGSIIYGRILYIMALHLIKLDGVLIRNQDISIVAQALISKKKQLCMISSDIRKSTLQSLLFLTFQFYRILYLLKRDQDLMTQYYNQIQAYISIYKTKCGNFSEFQNLFKIAEKIEKIKPLNLNLKIYDDHDRRRVLSVQNTEEELMKNHYHTRHSTNLSSQINAEMQNQQKKTLLRLESFQSNCDRNNSRSSSKLNDSEPKVLKQAINLASKQSECENTTLTNKFCFQFLKPDELGILKGKFQVIFTQNYDEFKVQITIWRGESMVGIFKIGGFGLEKKKNLGDCAKKLWRIIKQKFYTDKTQFVPNLFSFDYPPFQDIPKHINLTYELPILVRIHEMILHYLRKQPKLVKMNGVVLRFPTPKFESEKKQADFPNPESKIFAKRYGFISFNQKLRKNNSKSNFRMISIDREAGAELKLTFLIKQQTEYATVHIDMAKLAEKRIKISQKNQKNIKSERNNEMERQKIQNLCLKSQNQWKKKRIINIIDYLQNYKQEDEYFTTGKFYIQKMNQPNKNIEEEFEVMKSPILESKQNGIKSYGKFSYSKYKFKDNTQPYPFKAIKIECKFFIFKEEIFYDYTHYFDNTRQFFICPQNMDKVLVYTKFRLYKSVVFKDKLQNIYMKVSRIKKKSENGKKQLKLKYQKIDLKWRKTRILKTPGTNNYFYMNIFDSESRVILSMYDLQRNKNYMGQSNSKQISEKLAFDPQKMTINNIIKMEEFVSPSHKICEAQEFAYGIDV